MRRIFGAGLAARLNAWLAPPAAPPLPELDPDTAHRRAEAARRATERRSQSDSEPSTLPAVPPSFSVPQFTLNTAVRRLFAKAGYQRFPHMVSAVLHAAAQAEVGSSSASAAAIREMVRPLWTWLVDYFLAQLHASTAAWARMRPWDMQARTIAETIERARACAVTRAALHQKLQRLIDPEAAADFLFALEHTGERSVAVSAAMRSWTLYAASVGLGLAKPLPEAPSPPPPRTAEGKPEPEPEPEPLCPLWLARVLVAVNRRALAAEGSDLPWHRQLQDDYQDRNGRAQSGFEQLVLGRVRAVCTAAAEGGAALYRSGSRNARAAAALQPRSSWVEPGMGMELDIAWPAHRVLISVDGPFHYLTPPAEAQAIEDTLFRRLTWEPKREALHYNSVVVPAELSLHMGGPRLEALRAEAQRAEAEGKPAPQRFWDGPLRPLDALRRAALRAGGWHVVSLGAHVIDVHWQSTVDGGKVLLWGARGGDEALHKALQAQGLWEKLGLPPPPPVSVVLRDRVGDGSSRSSSSSTISNTISEPVKRGRGAATGSSDAAVSRSAATAADHADAAAAVGAGAAENSMRQNADAQPATAAQPPVRTLSAADAPAVPSNCAERSPRTAPRWRGHVASASASAASPAPSRHAERAPASSKHPFRVEGPSPSSRAHPSRAPTPATADTLLDWTDEGEGEANGDGEGSNDGDRNGDRDAAADTRRSGHHDSGAFDAAAGESGARGFRGAGGSFAPRRQPEPSQTLARSAAAAASSGVDAHAGMVELSWGAEAPAGSDSSHAAPLRRGRGQQQPSADRRRWDSSSSTGSLEARFNSRLGGKGSNEPSR